MRRRARLAALITVACAGSTSRDQVLAAYGELLDATPTLWRTWVEREAAQAADEARLDELQRLSAEFFALHAAAVAAYGAAREHADDAVDARWQAAHAALRAFLAAHGLTGVTGAASSAAGP